MVNKARKIIPRPLLEAVLNNHAKHHHRVPQPLVLHGPRGVRKTTLIQVCWVIGTKGLDPEFSET